LEKQQATHNSQHISTITLGVVIASRKLRGRACHIAE